VSKTIFTHPDNMALLKRELDSGKHDAGEAFPYFTVKASPMMDRDKPTGRYFLPGGKLVEKSAVRVAERFTEYGPEDVPYLLYAGLIKEQREALFLVMDDFRFRSSIMDFAPTLLPRTIFTSFT
jgi:hypothetical protein